jgi:hypothetical protein
VALRTILAILLLAPAAAFGDTLDALVITSSAADLATTEWALSRPGVREANPVMSEPAVRMAVKAVGTLGVLAGSRQLERHGHRGWSKALRITVIVVWSGAAINNAILARSHR